MLQFSSSTVLPCRKGAHRIAGDHAIALQLAGDVPHPAALPLEAIRDLPHRELGATRVDCFSGRPVTAFGHCRGVRLLDLLDLTGFAATPRSQQKRCVVVAAGGDGYQALFSWAELYNAEGGDQVLVIYERDGLPLDEHLGSLALLAAGDRHLGPRHLRRLESITVRRL